MFWLIIGQQDAKLKALKNLYDKDEILKDIENWSFKPRINSTFNKHALGSVSQRNDIDVYNRNEAWLKNREMKLMSLKSEREQNESEQWTFQPKISPQSKVSRSRIFETSDSKSKSPPFIYRLDQHGNQSQQNSKSKSKSKYMNDQTVARNARLMHQNYHNEAPKYSVRHMMSKKLANVDTSNENTEYVLWLILHHIVPS